MKMNKAEFFDIYAHTVFPASFRVIGIGETTAEIIEAVKSYGYDCVDGSVVNSPIECVPTDEDKMLIIVARDNEEVANAIAKTFHDAGVLTLALFDNADLECYDSVDSEASYPEYNAIIDAILRPIVTQGLLCYDFNDLRTTLGDSKHFLVVSATRGGNARVAEAIDLIKSMLSSRLDSIERISLFLYFNRDGKRPLVIQETASLNELLKDLPESIDVIWAVYPEKNLKDDEIKVSIIAAGKELDR